MADNEFGSGDKKEASRNRENRYLNFSVGSEVYGIDIRYVLQIIRMQGLTETRRMSSGMKGFINFRGNLIPAVSMRLRFGKTEDEDTAGTCIVVVRAGEKEIGMIVDNIHETTIIKPESILLPPVTNEEKNHSYIMGIARLANDRTVVLIHAQKLFADEA